MSKSRDIQELTGLLSQSLRHKIGSIVNTHELYAKQYAKNAATILNRAIIVAKRHTWNRDEKAEIRTMLYNKLFNELKQKTFLQDKKFERMDEEIDNALKDIL